MDDVTAAPRPAGEPLPKPSGARLACGFVAVHQREIFVGLSIAGILLLGPFAVNNFLQDRLLLGLATSIFVACLLVNAIAIGAGRQPIVSVGIIFVASLAGLASAMYNYGLIGVLWAYPAILLYHFMLPRRRANLFNLTIVALTIPMAWMHLGPAMTARVAVTLVLLIIFSNIFSHIVDAQQAREAEQRARLDMLVRQLEAQNSTLREAFRMREEVERIARHDLKTPLASIASVPRLLREHRKLDPHEDELVGMVERAALRVLSMVNLSLELYRMEQGTYRLRAQAVDVGALVQAVARELQAHAASKSLRLVLDLPPGPVYAKGEELLCYSILANLLKNALEASPEGADVRVVLCHGVHERVDAVVLDIHNLGMVPEPVRDTFFAKYATHGKPGGNGLGAYSAQLMARVQHGVLQMRSDAGGTTLSLRLPQWHGAAPRAVPVAADLAGAAAVPEPLPPLSVLLVDDDEYNVVVLKSHLPSPPLSVRTAVNGRAALERVREARPDVVFLDLEMPVMGGFEAAQRIRALQREQGERPSVIAAFSAHDDEATRRRCLEAGFDLYLVKPASREEVVAVLRGQDPAEAAKIGGTGEGRQVLVDPALMSLMPGFLASRLRLAQALASAAAKGERETVVAKAHQLAGSLALYGFMAASRASTDIERAAPTGELGALRAQCEALVELLVRARPAARGAGTGAGAESGAGAAPGSGTGTGAVGAS